MKKHYLFLTALLLLVAACNKDPEPQPSSSGEESNIIKNAATDYDGNVYDAVKIGEQIWLSENIRTTHTPDGTFIPVSDEENNKKSLRSYPGGDSNNVKTFGYLYNWPAIMNGELGTEANPSGVRGICPEGWHIPSDAEFTQMLNYVSSQSQFWCSDSTTIVKALCATREWGRNDIHCTAGYKISTNNTTGFNALPSGTRFFGEYHIVGLSSYMWTTTEYEKSEQYRELNAYLYYIISDDSVVHRVPNIKAGVAGLRCLKD